MGPSHPTEYAAPHRVSPPGGDFSDPVTSATLGIVQVSFEVPTDPIFGLPMDHIFGAPQMDVPFCFPHGSCIWDSSWIHIWSPCGSHV